MRDWLTKDFSWKIFSVILALVIWLTVHKIYEAPGADTTRASENTYRQLPVAIVSESADVHDFRVQPATISVTVSGPPDTMAVLEANQIRATVDLTGITSKKDLTRKVDISTPQRVTVVNVDPPQVTVIEPQKNP